ncbi:hypothetical protein [Parabacteroides sp. ZJ-118]|uniref:hypothetical protein n=1 Tax=Parabacteroides sp. ZJ-118 TaxID=2709398 RepID=UPI0013EAF7BF|nr:hypothetical protein [Parabacteroides sp. ZJ-118]
MTLIANPIYDSVFKYMMEDEKVANILLSALLKKEILELQLRQHEYTNTQRTNISLFRMDFSAKIKDGNGEEHLVLIELQKTWLPTETLRFRQYLGTHYLNKDNVCEDPDSHFGLPIISIYILGHTLGELKEPVIYVRRRYLDYEDNVIEGKDKFIESLTHDSIIVQIPFLQKRTRNRLERLLNIFDQNSCLKNDGHLLEIDENLFHKEDFPVLTRLLKAGVAPDVRRSMDVEDEILSEIEARDTALMQKDQLIQQKNQQIEQKNQQLEQKDQQLEQKDQQLEQKDQLIRSMIRMMEQEGLSEEQIARKLGLPVEQIRSLK